MKKIMKVIVATLASICLLFGTTLYATEDNEVLPLTWGEALNKVYTNNTSLQEQAKDLVDAKDKELISNWDMENIDLEELGSKFDQLNAEKQAELSLRTAQWQKEVTQDTRWSTQQSLKIQLYQAYYGLLQVQEELEQTELYKGYVEEIFQKAKQKKDNGLLTELDLEKIELQSMEATFDYNSAMRNRKNAQMELNVLMAESLDNKYEVIDEFYVKSPESIDVDSDISKALEDRNEFKEIRQALEINAIQMEILELNMFKSSPDYKDQKEQYDEYVWENTKLENQLKQQEYMVTKNVKDGYNDLLSLYTAMDQQKNEVQTARNEWELEKGKLQAGITTESDVLEKRYAMLQQELRLIKAEAEYNMARVKYQAAIHVGPAY